MVRWCNAGYVCDLSTLITQGVGHSNFAHCVTTEIIMLLHQRLLIYRVIIIPRSHVLSVKVHVKPQLIQGPPPKTPLDKRVGNPASLVWLQVPNYGEWQNENTLSSHLGSSYDLYSGLDSQNWRFLLQTTTATTTTTDGHFTPCSCALGNNKCQLTPAG